MIVCSCRAISDREFKSQEDLEARLLEDDIECGCCVEDLNFEKVETED